MKRDRIAPGGRICNNISSGQPTLSRPNQDPSILQETRAFLFQRFLSPALMVFATLIIGCGAGGKPIPPEEVGIAAKVQKQQRETGQEEGSLPVEEPVPPTEQPEELPSFFPIGVR